MPPHALSMMVGRPALALTSENAVQLGQEVTHTPRDTLDLVDIDAVAATARFLADLVDSLTRSS